MSKGGSGEEGVVGGDVGKVLVLLLLFWLCEAVEAHRSMQWKVQKCVEQQQK